MFLPPAIQSAPLLPLCNNLPGWSWGCWARDNQLGGLSPLEVWPPLELGLGPPLEGEVSFLLLGCCKARSVAPSLSRQLVCVAIFVNNLLTLVSAYAVLFPVGMLPFSATVSCWVAATTSDSGEISGLVMY